MEALKFLFALAFLAFVRAEGEPTQLTDETLDHFVNEYDVVMVNFYADWCRFCQQLRPAYEQASMLLGDSVNARLARVDCEAHDTMRLRERFHINKYPTLKIFRKGSVLKNEYRGQRSATAIEAYIRELVQDPVHTVESDQELTDTVHHQKAHEAITGRFSSPGAAALPVFRSVAEALRDECLFVAHTDSQLAGPSGTKISFQSRLDIVDYTGALEHEALLTWARDLCNPLVREITFENGEQLTEEGLPFLILFYDPNNLTPVREFTDAVRTRLAKERGAINFITADGTRFTHPIHHLGKTRADLPVLAFDTFKHMFLFKKFANIHKKGVLEQFVADLHSGKLHHDFHNPPAEVPEIEEASTPAPGPKTVAADTRAPPAPGNAAPAAPAPAADNAAAAAAPAVFNRVASNVVAPAAMEMVAVSGAHAPKKKKKWNVNLETALRSTVGFLKRRGDGHIDETAAGIIGSFLEVLCGVLTRERSSGDEEIGMIALMLNNFGMPAVGLQLATLKADDAVARALQLCILLLQASPNENEIVKENTIHPRSQSEFLKCLSEPLGRKALGTLSKRIADQVVSLGNTEDDEEEDDEDQHEKTTEELMEEEQQASFVVVQLLIFLRCATDGCYTELQNLLRACKLPAAITELAAAYSAHFGTYVSGEFRIYDQSRHETVVDMLRDLNSMRNHARVVLELSNVVSSMVAGPNRENQREFVHAEICAPLLLCLSFMEYRDTERGTIDLFRDLMRAQLYSWQRLFQVTATRAESAAIALNPLHLREQHFSQTPTTAATGLALLNRHLLALGDSLTLITELTTVDRRCEDSILQSVFGLVEGREPKDDVYDTVAMCAFTEAAGSEANDVLLHNLKHHYQEIDKHAHEHAHEDEEDLEHFDPKIDERKPNLAQTTLTYFMLLKVLSDESVKYGQRIRKKLKELKNGFAILQERIGRVELVKDGKVEVVYFPIPTAAQETLSSLVIQDLQDEVVDGTVLLPPEVKISEFLPKCRTVANMIVRQHSLQHSWKRYISQVPWVWIALCLVILININTIFDVNSLLPAARVLAYLHIVTTLGLLGAFYLNTFPIEQEWYAAYKRRHRRAIPAVRRRDMMLSWLEDRVRFFLFWSSTRATYDIIYLIFSLLGAFVSLRFFAFHLFDICLRVTTLGYILKAIFTNIFKLIAAFSLLFMLIYGFMLVGQSAFQGQYLYGSGLGVIQCDSNSPLLSCLRDSLFYGYQAAPNFSSPLPNLGALVFALLYFIIVVQIMTAVVGGIIIDSFARLRSMAQDIQDTKDNSCYICSMSRDVLDAASKIQFLGHVKHEHPVWHYAYFMIHIDRKTHFRMNLTGMELFFKKVEAAGKLTKLMPTKRAACKNDSTEAELDTILDAVNKHGTAAASDLAQLKQRLDALSRLAPAPAAPLPPAPAPAPAMASGTLRR
eukprot:m.142611 g.142611  ORF g.142611 m.142611 type:complete len:1423 (+) comp14974_c15_seq10:957-5225(+)